METNFSVIAFRGKNLKYTLNWIFRKRSYNLKIYFHALNYHRRRIFHRKVKLEIKNYVDISEDELKEPDYIKKPYDCKWTSLISGRRTNNVKSKIGKAQDKCKLFENKDVKMKLISLLILTGK